jgi:hypothetical protein
VPPKFCEPIQGVGASTAVRGRDAAPAGGYHARGEHRAYRHTDPLIIIHSSSYAPLCVIPCCVLALYQPREHYHLSVGKFQRIMICCRLIVGCQTILGSPPRATQAGGVAMGDYRGQPCGKMSMLRRATVFPMALELDPLTVFRPKAKARSPLASSPPS